MPQPYDIQMPDLLGQFYRGKRLAFEAERAPVEAQQHDQTFENNQQQFADEQQTNAVRQISMRAKFLKGLNPQARAQAYAAMRPQLDQLGQKLGLPPLPDVLSEDHMPELEQLSMLGEGQTGAGVQSTYIDNQGNRVAIMRDGSTQILGQNAPNNQIIAGAGGFYGVNRGDLTAAPVMLGGAPQQPPQQPSSTFALDDAALQSLSQIPPQERAAALQAMMTGGDFHVGANGQPVQGPSPGMVPTQLQPAPKPSETAGPKAPSGYRWNADETALEPIPGGPAQVAIEAKQAALDAKAEAGKVRQAESATAASQLVAAIDTLTASPGFSDLGTEWGDVKIGTPIIRNDAKDADAQLKNVAGQVALATMARLKALSAVGATGFGALTAPELKLLQNSIAALQAEDISNAELKRSLKNIRDTMQKVADWNEPAASPTPPAPASPKTAPKPGDREDGYMFKGGNPSDPRNWVKASR